jgi:plasmid maintenance system antidote protein VapI
MANSNTVPSKRRRCYTTDEMLAKLRKAVDDMGSQTLFAKAVGISQPMLSQILNKERSASTEVLDRIELVMVTHFEETE